MDDEGEADTAHEEMGREGLDAGLTNTSTDDEGGVKAAQDPAPWTHEQLTSVEWFEQIVRQHFEGRLEVNDSGAFRITSFSNNVWEVKPGWNGPDVVHQGTGTWVCIVPSEGAQEAAGLDLLLTYLLALLNDEKSSKRVLTMRRVMNMTHNNNSAGPYDRRFDMPDRLSERNLHVGWKPFDASMVYG